MRGFLSENVKLVKVKDHTADGTTAVTSDSVDTQGYDGVMFLTSFGTAATGNTLKVQHSTDDSSFSDLLGTSTTSGSSDEDVFVDIHKPQARYLRCVSARGTSTTQESVWAILYHARSLPVDNTTTGTIAGEAHLSPAAGTA